MMKHILDRSRTRADSDLEKAVLQAGKEMPRRETITLQRRSRMRDMNQRAAHFLRCARQDTQV